MESFYKVLSDAAYAMVQDSTVRDETTRMLNNIIIDIQEAIKNKKLSSSMTSKINNLLNLYKNSSYASNKLINEISSLMPIEEYIEKYNKNTLTNITEPFVKYKKDTILLKLKPNVRINNFYTIN